MGGQLRRRGIKRREATGQLRQLFHNGKSGWIKDDLHFTRRKEDGVGLGDRKNTFGFWRFSQGHGDRSSNREKARGLGKKRLESPTLIRKRASDPKEGGKGRRNRAASKGGTSSLARGGGGG